MDLKTLLITLEKIKLLDKTILIYLHLIINNLDKKSNELNFFQNYNAEYNMNINVNNILAQNQKVHKDSSGSFFNYGQKEMIFELLKILQNFICMKHFNEFKNRKLKELNLNNNNMAYNNNLNSNNGNNDNSHSNISDNPTKFYENCVTLILVISIKFSKINQIFSAAILENFLDHLESHEDCLIYFIFFYRSYLFCSNLKQVCKEYELFNYLFNFYKKFYKKSYMYELGENSSNISGSINYNTNNTKKLPQEKGDNKTNINSENKRLLSSNNNNNIEKKADVQVNKSIANNININNNNIMHKNINNIHKFINPEGNGDCEQCYNFSDFNYLINSKKVLIRNKRAINEEFKSDNLNIHNNNLIHSANNKKNIKISNLKSSSAAHSNNINSNQNNNLKSVSKSRNNSRRLFIENFIEENKDNFYEEKNKSESQRESYKLSRYNNNNNITININKDKESSELKNENNYIVNNTNHSENMENNENENENNNQTKIKTKFLNHIPKLNFNRREFINTKNKIQIENSMNINSNNEMNNNNTNININSNNNFLINSKNINCNNNNLYYSNLKNISNSPPLRSSSTTNKRYTTYHAFKNSIINSNPLNSKSDRKNKQSSIDLIINNNKNTNNSNINNSNQKNHVYSMLHSNVKRSSLSKNNIPELKFPLNTYEQHYSLSRSSQRNDFIKSSGSSTTTGQTFHLKKKFNLLNLPNKKDYLEAISGNSTSNFSKAQNSKFAILNQINPIKKLKILAQTLGESCLAKDLAALINHKRDMELEKVTKDKNKTMSIKKFDSENTSNNSHQNFNNLKNTKNAQSNGNNNIQSVKNSINNSLSNKPAINTTLKNSLQELKYKINLNKNKNHNNTTIKEEDFNKDKDSIDSEKKDKNIPTLAENNFFKNNYASQDGLLGETGVYENLHSNSNNLNNLDKDFISSEEKRKKKEIEYVDKLKNLKAIDSDEEYDNLFNNNKNLYLSESIQLKNILNKQQRFKSSFNKDDNYNNNNNNPSTGNVNNKSQNNNELSDLKKNFVFSFDNPYLNYNIFDNNEVDKNLYKMRELLANLLLLCLKEYSLEELSQIKINVNLLYSILLLPSLQSMSKKAQIKVCDFYIFYS